MANGSDTRGKAARPHAELLAEIMDSRIPKTEREHAAAREIERLTRERDELRHDIERALANHSADLRERDELHAERDAMRAALRIIAGYTQCADNTLGNVEIARAALAEGAEPLSSAEVATVARTAAIAARALAEGADGPREVSGWAIEGSWSPTNRPEYWVGSSVWSTDPYRALRFVAARDARQAAELMLDGINTRICEHSWSERPSCRHCGGVGYTQLDTAPGTTSCRYCEERPSGGEGT